MRRIIGGVFQSIDGVIQGPGGPTEDASNGFAHSGWMPPVSDEGAGEAIGRLFDRPFDLLLGRRTYEIFAAYWPFVSGDHAAIGATFTSARKYVLTRGDQPLTWANSHRLGDINAVAMLKQNDGPDLLIQGSSTLYPALLAAGLLDELVLFTFPVVIGSGKRLFGDGTPPVTLTPIHSEISPGGIVIARYTPAGTVAHGSFGQIESPLEDERQRRIGEGTW